MQRFVPYLFDRLIDSAPDESARRTLTLDQLKLSVAADVEALLNTRRGLSAQELEGFEHVGRSIAAFGLDDFAGRSMASTEDRAAVCRSIERAISDHEPRLRNVRVELQASEAAKQSLKFAIRAVLHVHPAQAPVNFDALLQTTTQHYAVAPARRPAAEGDGA